MFNLILVRYGEIALKSDYVRRQFEDILIRNIRSGLKSVGLDYKIRRDFGRIFLEGYDKKAERVLKRVFGIVSFSAALEIKTDLEKIKTLSLNLAKKYIKKSDYFAVECRRTGNHNFSSQDVERQVGAEIVKKIGCKVDLTKPEKILGIDIRGDKTYIFSDYLKGPGGVPLGTAGKVVSVIENFDGVIASWLFMKRGCMIIPVFIKRSTKRYLGLLEKWHTGYGIKPYYLDKFSIKRIEKIADENRVAALVDGDILGQVKKINSRYTIFSPLVGFSKNDLEKMREVIKR